MTSVFTYPWTLLRTDLGSALDWLRDAGIDGLSVASHYHSIQTLNPRAEDAPLESYPGGIYVDPDPADFENTPIVPPGNPVAGTTDPVTEIVAAAHDHGFEVGAWTVVFHNTQLAATHPDYRTESAFGTAHDHAFCPSHPDVHEYFAGVVRSLVRSNVDRIDLESIGFPSAHHSHGSTFGHAMDYALTNRAEELLFSQCFCDACREAAIPHPVDVDHARDLVQELSRQAFQGPGPRVSSLPELVDRHPTLERLFDFRAAVIEEFLETLADTAGDVPLNYLVSDGFGRGASDGWPAGVRLANLVSHLDQVTALCYVDDPATAIDRVSAIKDAVDLPVDAAVTLDPEVISTRSEWTRLVDRLGDVVDDVYVYNHGLMTPEHIEWVVDDR